MRLPPADRRLGRLFGLAGIDADTRPARQPVGRAPQKSLGAERIRQDDPQVAVMLFVPVGQNLVGRAGKLLVVSAKAA